MNTQLLEPVTETVEKFGKVFLLFGKCHRAYNAGKAINDSAIQELGMVYAISLLAGWHMFPCVHLPRSQHQGILELL